MILHVKDAVAIYTIIDSRRLVNSSLATQDDINDLCMTINAINKLGKLDTLLSNGYIIDKYQIPDEFTDMIVPCEIRISNSDAYVNLRSSYDATDLTGTILSPTEFKEVWEKIGANKRVMDVNFVDLNRAASDVVSKQDRLSNGEGDKVLDAGTTYVCPINMTISVRKDRFYTGCIHESFKCWFDNQFSAMRRKA